MTQRCTNRCRSYYTYPDDTQRKDKNKMASAVHAMETKTRRLTDRGVTLISLYHQDN